MTDLAGLMFLILLIFGALCFAAGYLLARINNP